MRFRTVGSDLEAAAGAAIEYFRGRGFTVSAEPYAFDYPGTPTIRCSRGKAKLFIEAVSELRWRAIDAWVAYAKTRDQETSLAILVRTPPGLQMEAVAELRGKRVGLYSYLDGVIVELVPPADLAVNISLPSIQEVRPPLRSRIQLCFDKIERGEWIDGFRDACQVLEDCARERLKDGVRRQRVSFVRKGKVHSYTLSNISKMPQGPLAKAYTEIQKPTQVDIVLGKALASVNKARITAVHKTQSAKNNARIRVQVGKHLWTVVSALKLVK